MDDKEYARRLFEILTGRWTRTSRWTHTAPAPSGSTALTASAPTYGLRRSTSSPVARSQLDIACCSIGIATKEPTPGRFVVRRSPARPERTLVVTPDQWEEVVRKHHIRRWRLLEHFSELLAGTEAAVGTSATRNHVNP
jgi:hypothetical protein